MHVQLLFPMALLCAIASAQVTIDLDHFNASKAALLRVDKDLNIYGARVAADPQYTRDASIVATASGIPTGAAVTGTGILDEVKMVASSVNPILTATPSWLAALPTGVQAFVRSVAREQANIINKDLGGADNGAGANPTKTDADTASPSSSSGAAGGATGLVATTGAASTTGSATSSASSSASNSVSKAGAAAATGAPGRAAAGLGLAVAGLAGMIVL